jgi:hypothetical protein
MADFKQALSVRELLPGATPLRRNIAPPTRLARVVALHTLVYGMRKVRRFRTPRATRIEPQHP